MNGRLKARRTTTYSRRRALALIAAGCPSALTVIMTTRLVSAQIVDWSADDATRYAAFRKAFAEYDDLADREFSARMGALFQTLDRNPDADVIAAEVSRRLPEYRDAPLARIQREMTALFRRARQHFDAP